MLLDRRYWCVFNCRKYCRRNPTQQLFGGELQILLKSGDVLAKSPLARLTVRMELFSFALPAAMTAVAAAGLTRARFALFPGTSAPDWFHAVLELFHPSQRRLYHTAWLSAQTRCFWENLITLGEFEWLSTFWLSSAAFSAEMQRAVALYGFIFEQGEIGHRVCFGRCQWDLKAQRHIIA